MYSSNKKKKTEKTHYSDKIKHSKNTNEFVQ